ncbi:MAG TPA: aminotransferase class V-fold PLP-dependent enzyme [Thermomicrobiales bacterium]|nr:aminotransferase class V-fold PLP-dependent enzyme [Thermomicrobiales bacterium]
MTQPFSAEEIARYRSETPGCAHVVHFNHAGSSLMPRPVVEAVIDHTNLEAKIGGYEAEDAVNERFRGVYDSVARLLNASSAEIALVENATRAWDMAFYAIPFAPGDRILTSISEYASNVIAFLQIAKRGVTVEAVPNDEHGQISLEALSAMLDSTVKLVSMTHMPTNGGLLQPAAAVGALARENGSFFLLDACQTAGQLPLDVAELECDFLSATSRKFLRGPRGVGFLYVREEVIDQLEPPMLDLHAAEWTSADGYRLRPDAKRFENWEKNYANHLGMGVAIDYALEIGLDRIWPQIERNAARLREKLSAVPGVTVQDLGAVKGGIVTFEIEGQDPDSVSETLRERWKINTSGSGISSTRFDMEARGIERMVRSSTHYFTTDEEIDLLASAVEEIARS